MPAIAFETNCIIDPLAGTTMSEVRCPKCAHPVPHLPEFAGKEAVCFNCGTHFKVPALDPDATQGPPYKVVWISAEKDLPQSPGKPGASSNKPQ
jgi:hypothetical protein